MNEAISPSPSDPRNTDPRTVWAGALQAAPNAVLPAIAIAFGTGLGGLLVMIPVFIGIIVISAAFSYIRWKRLTYVIGAQDIRVESGVLSRAARSVPYERIQDVSLEQKLIPRLFGLVSVKFETGAGGGEDLALQYLTEEDGEELRQLVRERRDMQDVPAAPQGVVEAGAPPMPKPAEEAEPLFAMGPGRLFTFGIFEFSLAVFAVLLGLLQYAQSFLDFDDIDADVVRGVIEAQSGGLSDLSTGAQALGAIGGIIGVILIGSLTGMVRVYAREWGFLLERTARGFRRRRGLFTRTDVVMPIHRVQGVKIGTGWLRYRFGWHNLSFVSLAQDMGASSHVVAPFARLDEIAPIVETAGFHLPDEGADWRRASLASLVVGAFFDTVFWLLLAAGVWWGTTTYAPEWTAIATAIPLALGALNALGTLLSWRFRRHALDERQIMATKGVLSPRSQIATRLKLHSIEISQGPFARAFGYATLHLGQAGGEFSIPGVPVERAREVRRKVMETIAATDFSLLESA